MVDLSLSFFCKTFQEFDDTNFALTSNFSLVIRLWPSGTLKHVLCPLFVLLGDIEHFASPQMCVCRRRQCFSLSLPLKFFSHRKGLQ